MKKFFALVSILASIILCSCSSNESDTFFVHAIGFEGDNEKIKLTAVLEQVSKEKEIFLTAQNSGTTINKAADRLSQEYSECYFATCELYFIPSSISSDSLTKIAETICDSNIFPTTSKIICIKDDYYNDFSKGINSSEILRQTKKETMKESISTIRFFTEFYSGNDVSIDTYSLKDSSLKKFGKTTFNKNKKAVSDEN